MTYKLFLEALMRHACTIKLTALKKIEPLSLRFRFANMLDMMSISQYITLVVEYCCLGKCKSPSFLQDICSYRYSLTFWCSFEVAIRRKIGNNAILNIMTVISDVCKITHLNIKLF